MKTKSKTKTPEKDYSPSALAEPGMPFPGIQKGYEIYLGDKVKVTEDRRSHARIANFPFEFPDNTRGVLIVLRIKDEPWTPSKDISNITINFK